MGFFGNLWGDITHPFGLFGGYHAPQPTAQQQPGGFKPPQQNNGPAKMGNPTLAQPTVKAPPPTTNQPQIRDVAGNFTQKTPLGLNTPGDMVKIANGQQPNNKPLPGSFMAEHPQAQPNNQQQPKVQPKGKPSFWDRVGHDITHNTVTDFAGSAVVKPAIGLVKGLTVNPAENAIETGRMAVADATGNVKAQQASQTREAKNLKSSLPYQLGDMAYNIGKANTYDLVRQALEPNNKAAQNAYMQDINKTPIGQLFNPAQHALAKYQVNRDLKGLTPAQKAQVVKENLAKVNINPNESLGTQLGNSAISAVTLATGPKALEGGAPWLRRGGKDVSTIPEGEVVKEAPSAKPVARVVDTSAANRAAAARERTLANPLNNTEVRPVAQTSPVSGREVTLPAEPGTPPSEVGAKASLIEKPTKYAKAADGTNALEGRIPIKQVQGGDYGAARVAPQLASNPIDVATGQAVNAIKALSKGDRAQLIDAIEHPEDHPNMSPKLAEAVRRVNYLTDRVHATSNALATDEFGKVPYINNYYHHEVDLSNPQDAARFQDLLKSSNTVMPENFHGINNMPRVFNDVRELHNAGFKLVHEGDPAKQILEYGARASNGVKRQALIKAATEADTPEQIANGAPRTLDLGGGKNIILSDKGIKEFKGYEMPHEAGKLLSGYRKLNKGFKQTLLSVSQFHPININALQAAPALALRGHPILAAQGLGDTIATLVNRGYSDKLLQGALEDGTIDKAAMMGTPIKFGSDFRAGGKLDELKQGRISGFGEKAIFERQLPAMHIKMVQALSKDLENRNIPLDSPQALQAGTTVNKIMGYINTAVQNHDPRVQKALGDILLAPQFTRAKWEVLGDALIRSPKSISGQYARAAVLGKYMTEVGLMQAGGAATGQKQNSLVDNMKQALVSPAIPTPWKDSKGNTIKLRIPSNYVSEPSGLVASESRGSDGRIHINVNPGAIPDNLETYGRERLAVIPGNVLKVATNQNFAGVPMYDANAPTGTKIEQAGATVAANTLPIGLQGVAETNAVDKHLPKNISDVLQAEKPGTNPVLKSIMSSFGATPETDKTTGKGLQTTQYYSALDAAKKGLNANDLAAFNSIHQQTKDPVTGKYIIKPTVFDSMAKGALYQAHPNVLAADTKLNKTLAAEGQKVDPFFTNLTPAQQKAYLAYETMQPLSADRTDWENKNPWYKQFANQQSAFFNSLPPADPNRPTSPIKYPQATGQTLADTNQYYGLTNATDKTNFLNTHPDVVTQLNAQYQYDNALRTARGYAAVKGYPTTSPQTQNFMTQYNNASTADRKVMRNANPQLYQNMIGFYDAIDLYNINKQGGVSQLAGEPDYTSKEAKDIASLSSDIYTNKTTNPNNPTYKIIPAGWMGGAGNMTPAAYGSSSSSASYMYPFNAPTNTYDKKMAAAMAGTVKKMSPNVKTPTHVQPGYTARVGSSKMTMDFKKTAKAKPYSGKITKKAVNKHFSARMGKTEKIPAMGKLPRLEYSRNGALRFYSGNSMY